MFKKKKTTINDNSNSMSICIWGDGPGRPYDNVYSLAKKEEDKKNNTVKLFFNGNEACIIENPQGVTWEVNRLKIKTADKIIWKFYYYGKPQTDETLIIIEYNKISDTNVRVIVKGNYFNRDEVINVKGKIALDSI